MAGMVAILYACGDSANNNNAGTINARASLPDSLKFTALGYKVVTLSINKKLGTMSTLYGNKQALDNAIAGADDVKAGEAFALITWKQQDDDRWFGAKIPGNLQSVEMIKTAADASGKVAIAYTHLEGKNLSPIADTLHNAERIKYIFDQKPSVMP
ncbi:hypothetical protein RG47T_3043 [Mucilaginibacter polytrichastri]|uniref:Uncharacterized protein n=2 Tax=Mucilaginibacter polytrichastri TaxID=1302689 RepID=A0A1Q6A0T0_9SPHI|nr:hypothetical protein RG47T_3043 [Mucilaginibacter polytrichastri]